MEANQPIIRKWKITKLKPHARQEAIFGDLPNEELTALAKSMKEHGLRDPVEILPDGTIICGHQRVRAAKLLAWKEIDVVVRDDLAAAGPAAVETYFVEDNFVRRQLSPLGRARCLKRLMEIEEDRDSDRFGFMQKEALKALIATRMEMSPRNVNRYLLILNSPVPVQRAFDRSKLSLSNAGKVALMSKAVQGEIARRIETGEDAAKVVGEYLAAAKCNGTEINRAFDRLSTTLRRETSQLKGRILQIDQRKLTRILPALKVAKTMLIEIIKRAERQAS